MVDLRCLALGFLLILAGCAEPESMDSADAPDAIQDGSLDYQDYKEAGCPYLGDSLDAESMRKCNQWIRKQHANETSTNQSVQK